MTYEEFEARYDYNPDTDRIGGGGFGQVYKARDTVRKRWVAIKECKVEPNKFTLEREVQLVAELGLGENIARYENNYRFKLGRVEMDYAVMHYYEEGSLATVLTNYTLSDTERIEIVKGLLAGLGFIHREGFIHRDFKPGNVLMLKENGRWIPKITDFGMSKLKKSTADLTQNSATAKTLAYSAPEQIQNRPIKDNTDLWALGVTVYKMCTGRLPYTSDATTSREIYNLEISEQIVSGKLPDMTGIKEPFRGLIERCLVFDMDQRVQSAGELMVLFDDSKPSEQKTKPIEPTPPKPDIPKPTHEDPTDVIEPPILKPIPQPLPPPSKPTRPLITIWPAVAVIVLTVMAAFLIIKFGNNSKKTEEATIDYTEVVDSVAVVENGPISKETVDKNNVLDIENIPCTVLQEPTFEGQFAPNNLGSTVNLRLIEKKKNNITDVEKWLLGNSLELSAYEIPIDFSDKTNLPKKIPLTYKTYKITEGLNFENVQIFFYGENFSESRFMLITDKEMSNVLHFIDFVHYLKSPKTKAGDEHLIFQYLNWAIVEDGILYVSNSHSTYAESSVYKNAYITAIDLNSYKVIWRSEPLTSNCNFTIIKDNIICGYGFTAEPDFLYILNKYSGKRQEKISIASGPEYIIDKEEYLYVRTYDTDYKFKIDK